MSRRFTLPATNARVGVDLVIPLFQQYNGGDHDITTMSVWNPASVSAMGLFHIFDNTDTHVLGINPYSDGKIYLAASGFAGTGAPGSGGYTASDGWRIDVFRKLAGSSPVVHDWYLFSEGVWHNETMGSVGGSSGTPAYINLGSWDADESLDGWLASTVLWRYYMPDDDIPGLEGGTQEALKRNPMAVWELNQDEAVPITDLTWNHNNEVISSGTVDAPSENPSGYILGRGYDELFTTQVPEDGFGDQDNTSNLTLGTTMTVNQSGLEVIGFKYFSPTHTVGYGEHYLGLYVANSADNAGATHTRVVEPIQMLWPIDGAWNYTFLDTPLALNNLKYYKVAHYTSVGRYTASRHYFDTAHTSPGTLLTGIQGETDPLAIFGPDTMRNGSYNDGGGQMIYPSDTFNHNSYLVDMLVREIVAPSDGAPESTRFMVFF